jgi:pyruvate/2-oxoglutarate dehydrogenase complex dihydrolipoamide acyltransferase (E2) component
MEMEVCGPTEAQQVGESLTQFFNNLDIGDNEDEKVDPAPRQQASTAKPTPPAPAPSRSSTTSSGHGGRSNIKPNEQFNATSSASRRQDEMKNMFGTSGGGGGGMSVKDRMKMFNNNQTFECDPTAFAMKLNKAEKGELLWLVLFCNSVQVARVLVWG